MQIKYYKAPCGGGKSYNAAIRMVSCPGRYIVVRDRVDAIKEYSFMLSSFANQHGISVPIATVTAHDTARNSSVRHEVENIPNRYDSLPHVIVIITHKAMLMSDFTGFEGWHMIIDETPVVLDRQDLQTKQSREFFERNYLLDPINKATNKMPWSSVSLSPEGWSVQPADLEADDCFRLLRVFHERVTAGSTLPDDATMRMARRHHADDASRRAVIGNLADWSDMEDGRHWTWWSLWSPKQLASFDSIEIMANGFDKSVTFQMLKAYNPDIDWIETALPSSRHFERRKVVIEYFAANHQASQSLFDSQDGKNNLNLIARHQAARHQIWMANDRHAGDLFGIGGQHLRPHQAGSNKFEHYHAATCIYAAKPSEQTRAVMDFMGLPADAWTRSYEHEAILQFVCRTSVRNPSSHETVTFTVYDKVQTEYLAEYFADQSHCDLEIVHVDLGMVDDTRKRGRKVVELSVEDAEAKKAQRIKNKTEAQRARRAKLKAKVDA